MRNFLVAALLFPGCVESRCLLGLKGANKCLITCRLAGETLKSTGLKWTLCVIWQSWGHENLLLHKLKLWKVVTDDGGAWGSRDFSGRTVKLDQTRPVPSHISLTCLSLTCPSLTCRWSGDPLTLWLPRNQPNLNEAGLKKKQGISWWATSTQEGKVRSVRMSSFKCKMQHERGRFYYS